MKKKIMKAEKFKNNGKKKAKKKKNDIKVKYINAKERKNESSERR